ncbi:Hypothetical predicted protein [Olea europaea subsp. europaea]|uniref:Uncharacterized protein n=1 Tax=Olea europaea subsp. europaea TaxID=158383 RepID=A0A8S0RLD0_OLEEU|nr:Hypothetical predicted protein [Olea europaea subsp. europaea]
MTTAMSLRIKISLLVSLFLLLFLLSPGTSQGFGIGVNKVDLLHEGWRPGTLHVHANPRKLLKVDASLDYDYAGPNPKHDSRGRRGGKNP